ncbi:MHYT domain-containing protein [Lentzea tibetensis]|nr:MHYT domain-containing protein [Lentzea tibetensis]
MGIITPLVAYSVSCVGSALGLLSTERARNSTGAQSHWWLVVAAVAIGGMGIWVMHFTAMLGTWMGTNVAYDVPLTLLSMVVAIVVVGVGLFVVSRSDPNRLGPLAAGGVFTGVGVAAMHYTGMSAVTIGARVSYDIPIVLLSVLIAVVAATAALWATMNIRGPLAVVGAALVMGLAVTGMHYTGMAAMKVVVDQRAPLIVGNSQELITSLIIGVIAVCVIIIFLLVLTASSKEFEDDAELLDRVIRRSGWRES